MGVDFSIQVAVLDVMSFNYKNELMKLITIFTLTAKTQKIQ